MININTLDYVGLLGEHIRAYQADASTKINVLKTHDIGVPTLLLPPKDYDALFQAIQDKYVTKRGEPDGQETQAPSETEAAPETKTSQNT